MSLFCPYLLPLNYHNSLKYNMKAFQKTCAPRCAKLCFLLKLSLCIQEPFKKYIYVKNWHLWDFGPKFRFFFFFFFFFFKCPIATSPLVVLRKIWSHFCPWTIGVGPWKLAFLSYFGQRKRHFFDSKHAKTAKIGKN